MDSELVADRDPSLNFASSLGYQGEGQRRDEALCQDGKVEPEWFDLFESIHRHGIHTLADWRRTAARVSRERGLAYRPASIDGEPEAGWTLDPIPWIISPERWAVFEAGIAQRSRLFAALLSDVYGEQRTLKERLFPAEILLNHRGFLRTLHNLPPGEGVIGLGISAFDIARDSAGQAFVVNDRFDAPFGLGLALENRTVVNQILPRLFGRCGVRRIGQFFTDWFDYLGRCSPTASNAPQVVILDPSEPGEDSEIGFLANYCGISRVHPSDLTVRDGRVWIRALRGLVPVDVVWKMMPGANVDSLESERSVGRGTAGLFEALRGGGVAIASHPGVEVLQSPGFYPYLPMLCRHLLDEDLLIPPVATWWCGQQESLSYVVENLPSMVIKSVGPQAEFRTRYGSRMSAEELVDLKAQITAHPTAFVGQEELVISTIPTSRRDSLVPRAAVLRMFAFNEENNRSQVMPGGLARFSTADGVVVSTRDYGESKDVWVRSPSEEQPFSIASALSHTRLVTPEIIPSRTGENLFWTGRYAERTDAISRIAARIVEGQIRGFSREAEFGNEHEKLLIRALFKIFENKVPGKKSKTAESRLRMILCDRECPVGVPYNLDRFFNASQIVREEWSSASTLAISSCYDAWHTEIDEGDLITAYDSQLKMLQLHLAGFHGLNLDTMTRDEGWALLDAGRRIERAAIVCGLLRFLLRSEVSEDMNTLFNESILYSLDSVRTFQSRFHDVPSTHLTVQLLLGEPDYPRSVVYALQRIKIVLSKLPVPANREHPGVPVAAWIEKIELFTAEIAEGRFQSEAGLQLLDDLRDFLKSLSDSITVSYFSHAEGDA
jgi:uncharacterized circularly permuted ATP-grasp superfamily protein/uncharacterized alpha-E superfamily protein